MTDLLRSSLADSHEQGNYPKGVIKEAQWSLLFPSWSDLAPLLDWESIRERAEGYKVRGPSI